MEQTIFSDRELTRLLVLTAHLESLLDRDLDDQVLRTITRCWTGLRNRKEMAAEHQVFFRALYRHYHRGYPMEVLSSLTGVGIATLSRWFCRLELPAFEPTRRTRYAGPPARRYEVNPHALDDPSIPVVAYVLGFLWADGHLLPARPDVYEGLRVVLQRDDVEQLKLIRRVLGSSAPITYPRSSVQPNGLDYPQCALEVHSVVLAAKMAGYGFGQRHAGQSNAAPPAEIRVAEADFWRGMVDGDGCLRRDPRPGFPLSGWRLELAATQATCTLFSDWITRHLPDAAIDCRRNGISEHNYRISVSGPSAVEAMAILYPAGCIGLARKVRRARRVVEAAELAGKLGIQPGQVGSRRQWVGSSDDKAELVRRLEAIEA